MFVVTLISLRLPITEPPISSDTEIGSRTFCLE